MVEVKATLIRIRERERETYRQREIEREAGLGLLAMNLPFQEPELLVEL